MHQQSSDSLHSFCSLFSVFFLGDRRKGGGGLDKLLRYIPFTGSIGDVKKIWSNSPELSMTGYE